MKKYKFRIWNIKEEIWDNPNILEIWNKNGVLSVNTEYLHAEDYVIQQWTGILDKNKVEIYEGDIVSVYEPDNLFEVCFGKIERTVVSHDEATVFPVEINGFYFKAVDDRKAYFSIIKNSKNENDLAGTEVVGNIFEVH